MVKESIARPARGVPCDLVLIAMRFSKPFYLLAIQRGVMFMYEREKVISADKQEEEPRTVRVMNE